MNDTADPVHKTIHREKDKKVMTTALSMTKTDLTKLRSGLFLRLRSS